jgi:hypothetical protein
MLRVVLRAFGAGDGVLRVGTHEAIGGHDLGTERTESSSDRFIVKLAN